MDSTSLRREHFEEYAFDLNTFSLGKGKHSELCTTGLYVFVLSRRFDRLLGTTDILYIGQSGGKTDGKGRSIVKRIYDYVHSYASAPNDRKMNESLKLIESKLEQKVRLFYKQIKKKESCREEEKDLLVRFRKDHIELPPLNSQS